MDSRLGRIVNAWLSDIEQAHGRGNDPVASKKRKRSCERTIDIHPLDDQYISQNNCKGVLSKGRIVLGEVQNFNDNETSSPVMASPTKSIQSRPRSPVKKAVKRRYGEEQEYTAWKFVEEDEDTVTMTSFGFAISETAPTSPPADSWPCSRSQSAASSISAGGSASGSRNIFRARSRSSSPTKSNVGGGGGGTKTNVRMLRENLGYAVQPMYFGPISRAKIKSQKDVYPDSTLEVVQSFSQLMNGHGFIPKSLDTPALRNLNPLETFQSHMFSSPGGDIMREKILFHHVVDLHDKASTAFERNMDESSWYPVVRAVLEGPDYSLANSLADLDDCEPASGSPLDVSEALTKNMDSSLLPVLPPPLPSIPGFKVDFLLEFDHDHNLTRSFYEEWYQSSKNLNMDHYYLSPILDASSARRILFCPVEVKPSHGDYAEASLQMGIISRAAQMKIPRQLSSKSQSDKAASSADVQSDRQYMKNQPTVGEARQDNERPKPSTSLVEAREGDSHSNPVEWLPTPGLTVVGHSWALHWTYRKDDGSSRVLGPFYCGDTSSVAGIFRLVRVVAELKQYAQERYWPWITRQYRAQ